MVSKNSRLSLKAQVSMEYLIIFGIAFAMTLPLIIIYAKQTENMQADVSYAQVYKVASKMGDYADEVYFAGRPSQRTVTLIFPDHITAVSFNGSMIIFNVTTSEMSYVVVKETSANLTGSVGNFIGPHIIVFKAEKNYVNITEK